MRNVRRNMILPLAALVILLLVLSCREPGLQDELDSLAVQASALPTADRGYAECFPAGNLSAEPVRIELALDGESGLWGGSAGVAGGVYRVVTTMETADGETAAYSVDEVSVDGTASLAVELDAGYTVGEETASGGFIFHEQDARSTAMTGWRYLCCAPGDWHESGTDPVCGWSYSGRDTGLTRPVVGAGLVNCTALDTIEEIPASAVGICMDHSCADCTDWFLPSAEELQLLYERIYLDGETDAGFVEDGFYWSSTEADEMKAYCWEFSETGKLIAGPKLLDNVIRVRPVRTL